MPSHADFLDMSTDRQWVWGVRDFYQSVRVVYGRIGTVAVTSIAGVILLAPVAFAWNAVQQGRPALVVWAPEDRVNPREHGRRFAELLLHGRLIEIADSYTLMPLDQPGELARAIRQFIRDTP